jgi:hypothetical protein
MGVRATVGSSAPAVPGELATSELTVENTGDRVEDVRLALAGEPVAWAWVTPATLSLATGERAVARLAVRVPRATRPPAGPLTVTVRVATAGGTQDVPATIEVAPFVDLHITLDPRTTPGGRKGRQRLTVENRGNAGVRAGVTAVGEDVTVSFEPDRVALAPGSSAEVRVTAGARRPRFRGATVTRPYEVLVSPEGGGRPAHADGAVEVAPSGWVGRVTLLLLVLAVAGAGLGALFGSGRDDDATDETVGATAAPSDCPARDHLSPDANGIVRDGVKPSFDYSFLFVTGQGCQPVRFNPCQPVQYALNRRLAGDADVADLLAAIGKLAAATGLEFRRVADTDEDPRLVPRPRRQPDGTFVWPPVVIGWSHLGSGDALRGRNDQRASPDVVVGGGGRPEVVNDVIVTGNLILNLDAVTDTDSRTPVPHGFGNGVNWGRIMLHELAHVIGLGHVESRTSIMNEALTQQTLSSADWGGGDLIGLRQLGRDGGCVTVPPVPSQGAPR